MIQRIILSIAVLFGVLLFLLPKPDEAGKQHMASAGMLACSKDFRQDVIEQLKRGDDSSPTFNNTCPGLIRDIEAGPSGEVTIHGVEHHIVMTLRPVFEGDKMRWSCQGSPAEFITKLCKP